MRQPSKTFLAQADEVFIPSIAGFGDIEHAPPKLTPNV
jgi:hypothetical protein